MTRPKTTTIYARVSAESKEYIDELAARTGLPIAAIVDALIRYARDSGLIIERPIAFRAVAKDPE